MQEGHLLMTQVDRVRLVALKKAQTNVIRQQEAAQVDLSIWQVQGL